MTVLDMGTTHLIQRSFVEVENNEEEDLEIDPMAVAASGYGHKGGKKSKKHKAHYGDKGVKGYKGKKWGKKGKKYFKKHFDKKYKKKKGHHEGKKFHGDFFKGNKGHKAAKYGKKGHHNKGHKTKGFKNTYHKNEYSKKTKFYDSFDNGGYHKKFGGYKGYYGGSKGKKFKGGKHTGGFHGDDFGKKDLSSELLMDDPHPFESNDHHDIAEDVDHHNEHRAHALPPATTTTTSSLEPVELHGTNPAYAVPGGYASTGGYSSLGGYPSPAPGGYFTQGGYSTPGGYSPPNNFASPQAYPSKPTTPTHYYSPEHYKTGGHGYLMGYHENLSPKTTHPVTPQIVYAIPSTQAPQAYHPFSGFYQTNSRQLQKRSPQDNFGHHSGEFDAVQDIGVPKKPHSMFASSFALRRIPKLEFKDVETTASGVPVFHDPHKLRPQARGGSSFGGVYSYGPNHNQGEQYPTYDYDDGSNQGKAPNYDDYGPGANKALGGNVDYNDYGPGGQGGGGGGFGGSGHGAQGHKAHDNSDGFHDFADVFNADEGGAGGGGGGRGRGRGRGGQRGGGGGGGGGADEFEFKEQGGGYDDYDPGNGPSQGVHNDYGGYDYSLGNPNREHLRHGGNSGQQAQDDDAPPYGDFAFDDPVPHDVPRGNQNRGAGVGFGPGAGLGGGVGGGGTRGGAGNFPSDVGGASDSFGFGSDPGFDFR
ncbi:hypothetical protein TCAL_10697 [Tigriopus californicus]|uniref:Uncharacterized protein n=1 Tax=Tigriopus californicus TaxID=6832 RepID=A0A553P074_TIGCA|nr:hypothetical protein TCAL_10697 [Tigriopus californicus]